MLNYVTKAAEVRDGLAFESINSAGSYGLLSTYNGVAVLSRQPVVELAGRVFPL